MACKCADNNKVVKILKHFDVSIDYQFMTKKNIYRVNFEILQLLKKSLFRKESMIDIDVKLYFFHFNRPFIDDCIKTMFKNVSNKKNIFKT